MTKFKPLTPGLRHKVSVKYGEYLCPSHLLGSSLRASGRSNGKIVVRGKGGGSKHHRVLVDGTLSTFSRGDIIILRFLSDSRRGAPLMEVSGTVGIGFSSFLMVAIDGLKVGDIINSDNSCVGVPQKGFVYKISDLPLGTILSNINGKLIRSAGTFGVLVSKDVSSASIKVRGRHISVPPYFTCVVGRVANPNRFLSVKGKAGLNRGLGLRPKVRGSAINPVDHPHGGGEGKSSASRPSVSPWGRLTKGWKRM